MPWLLRHSARLRPRPVILAAGLAVAALILFGNVGVAAIVLLTDTLIGMRFSRARA